MDWIMRVLAAYRLTNLVLFEEGPFEINTWVHENIDKKQETWVGRGLNCPACVSFWMALLVIVMPKSVAHWLGIAGVLLLAKKYIPKFLEN